MGHLSASLGRTEMRNSGGEEWSAESWVWFAG